MSQLSSVSCQGCVEEQPNQLAHMEPGGCLYESVESEPSPLPQNEEETPMDGDSRQLLASIQALRKLNHDSCLTRAGAHCIATTMSMKATPRYWQEVVQRLKKSPRVGSRLNSRLNNSLSTLHELLSAW